jgi:DNA polymerase-1
MVYLVTLEKTLFEVTEYKIISVEESLQLLKSCKRLQYDSETTGLDPHINHLLCIQFGSKEKDFQMVIDCTTINVTIYKEILESTILVGHNLKFDLQFLYSCGIIPRRVYDTMIVEQLLHLGFPYVPITPEEYIEFNYSFPYHIKTDNYYNEYYELSFALDAVAKKYLNIEIDKTVRGQIIYRGLDAQVILYAAKDVEYLEDIMKLQVETCKQQDCLRGAKLECDFTPVIAYLEWCGIKLDVEKWTTKMKSDLENLNKSKKDLDDWLLIQVNTNTFKQIKKKYVFINNQMDLFEGWDLTPKVTLNWSSSKQVIEIAKLLGFNTVVQDKKTGEDKDSVLEKHLKSQKGINDKFLDLYFKYQEYAKVVSSFGQAQLNMVHPNTGRCHTSYKALGAASGRMSCGSSQPNTDLAKLKKIPAKECTYCNFQQLPSDEVTRSCFIAEKGNLFCSCDFSALESRLGADIYNEHSMIEEFLYKSGDIHSLVAKACFSELKDKTTEEIKKDFPHLRKKAKPIGFSQQFGGSAMAIAQSLGCPLEEAEQIADSYLKGFPGIAEFKKQGSKAVRNNGYVLMCKETGHKMYWWDHKKWLKRQQSFTPEFWESYRLYHKGTGNEIALQVREHFKATSKWDRMALNAPTQSTGAIILKDAMSQFFNYIIDNNLFNIVKIVALVHDEANIEYPKELNMDEVLKSFMEASAAKYCKSLPIPAEASVGDHWIH